MEIESKVNYKVASLLMMVTLLIVVIRVFSYDYEIISKATVIFTFFLTVYFVYIKKNEYILICLMLTLEFDAVLSPHNFTLTILLIGIITSFMFRSLTLGHTRFNSARIIRTFLFLFFWYCLLTVYRVFNFNYSEIDLFYYIVFDLKMFLIIPCAFILFRNIDFARLELVFYIIAMSYILFVLFGYIMEYSSLNVATRNYVGYSSQLTLILAIFSMKLFLHQKVIDLIVLISIVSLMIITSNVISQNILVIIIASLFAIFSLPKSKIIIIAVMVILSITLLNSFVSDLVLSENILTKIENITSVVNSSSIYLISTSPLIRILEFLNISLSLSFFEYFGGGFGAYFTDAHYKFPMLTLFDFSQDQLNSNVFFIPHNINYGYLKFGWLYIIGSLYLFSKLSRVDNHEKPVIYGLFIFSFLNVGFTYLPSLFLGLVLSYAFKEKNNCN